jgi:hypothetical protein
MVQGRQEGAHQTPVKGRVPAGCHVEVCKFAFEV